ncbi:Adenylate kinase/UMP-CMP kinase [Carpediemonas membranifera]|uniref:Adenylate kinase/UMP-CMP kinase n=1 Tax=Carpediemonas membranifera TaxID=201153 RepID=A0A8J6DZC4_9EUKA|nr:Adenylate kinase/UMP-CMP kinase [Carpediemonas membranifera]|eukprot:KAG9390221.1 Adenylate kinase/UMP-CMP kinase [Carpediemonas membranifera]
MAQSFEFLIDTTICEKTVMEYGSRAPVDDYGTYGSLDASIFTARQTHDEIERLNEQLVALQLRNFYLEEQLAMATGQDMDSIHQQYESIDMLKNLKDELMQRDHLLKENQHTINLLEGDVRRLSQENAQYAQGQAGQQSTIAKCQADAQDLRTQLGAMEQTVQALEGERNNLARALDQSNAAIEAVESKAKAQEQQHREEVEGLESRIEELRLSLAKAHGNADKEAQKYRDEMDSASNVSQATITELKAQLREKADALDETMSRATALQKQVNRLGEHNKLLALELEEKRARLDEAVERWNRMTRRAMTSVSGR